MSTIQTRRRSVLIALASVLTACLAGLGHLAVVSAAPIASVLDENSELRGAAAALSPALRLNLDTSKPIFPMQVTPRCYILDNFGEARSSGRSHEGTDILATLGQEVYAVVDGTLGNQVIDGGPNSSLSGNGWRLTAANSKTWYVFMHLSGFAPGLSNGSVVKQGQLIGFVGNTGNPGPDNFHLHFEVHPNGGNAINALTVIPIPAGCTVY